MLIEYPAFFYKEKNGYSVIFPDLNYLATNGDTLDQALSMAVDCLAGYLYWLEKSGEARPEPSSTSQIKPEELAKELEIEYTDCFGKLVPINTTF